MRRREFGIFVPAFVVSAAWLYAEPAPGRVRVRLFSIERPSQITLTAASGATSRIEAGALAAAFRTHDAVSIRRGTFEPVSVEYPLEISARNGTLAIVAEMGIEEYVAAVLAGEAAGFRSESSLTAMAVAIRTYAAHFIGRHKSEGFDFCDATHCQDLRLAAVTRRLQEAAETTRGEVLEHQGRTIPAYYHQDCGGITEPRAPYLPQLRDAFCMREHRRWEAEITAPELESTFQVADAYQLEVIERTVSGRAQKLRLSGSTTGTMDAEAFRLAIGRALGWNRLRSDLYEVRPNGRGFVFEGAGSGHGIGLCQEGAAAMGEQGRSNSEILAYYYPTTRIVSRKF